MKNENTKNELLNEIIDLSNSNLSDIKIDTTKFGDIMKEFQDPNKKHTMKRFKTKDLLNFNFDQALSDNKNPSSENIKTEQTNKEKDNNIFEQADDILENFNKNLKKDNHNDSNNNKLNSIIEENENINDDKYEEKNNDIKIESNNIILENDNKKKDMRLSHKLNLKSCEFKKEENIKSLGNIFDDILNFDEKNKNKNKNISNKQLCRINIVENDDNKNNEIKGNEDKRNIENSEKETNSSNLLNKEKEEDKIIKDNEINIKNKKNKEDNKNININKNEINNTIKDKNDNTKNLQNEINENNKNKDIENLQKINNNNADNNENKKIDNDNDNDNKNNKKIEETKLEYTRTKIDLVEKTEYLFFSKNKDISELKQYLNNKYKDINSNLNTRLSKNKTQKCEKIYYKITQSFPKNKLNLELINKKITSVYLDNEEFIYCGDEKGNLLIYSIKDEKLVKQLDNPFIFELKNNKKLPIITSISSDDQYVVAGYEMGRFSIFLKNDKKPIKTKIYEAFQEISQHNIIEVKIYSKKKNSIIIYSSDDHENIYRTKIIKNKIFRNKVSTNRIIGPIKNVKKKEPYYYLEINPFFYKCLGTVNNRGVYIYIIRKLKKEILFRWDNLDEENSFLSFFFSKKEDEKNKFFISNLNRINIYEINSDYNGAAQQKIIILKENIIKIGAFINNLIYAFDEKNIISFINYNSTNDINKDNINDKYGFYDTIQINNNNNDEAIKNKEQENIEFLLYYKNFLSVNNGTIFMYNKNNILFVKSLSLYEGISIIYNSIFITQSIENWDIIFSLGIDIYKKEHPIWKIDKLDKFQDLYISYSQSFLSLLIIKLDNNQESDELEKIINKFNELISFLFEIKLYNFIIEEKNNLYSIFCEGKLEDLYFYLLEPFIIENKFINMTNLQNFFINKLMDIYLYKKNKESKYINNNKSWLCELLIHFNIKKYIEKGKNNSLLENIKENNLINVIIYFILNYKFNEVMVNNSIDYCTPLDMLIHLLKSNIKKKNKNNNLLEVDLNNQAFFKKEFRYKDEIIYSNEYIRIKILWYIYTILKNKIIKDDNKDKDKNEDYKKTLFIKEIIKILNEKELFNIIIYGDSNNNNKNNGYFLGREIIYIIQIIFENEIINKYHEIDKEKILIKLIKLLENKKESQISLNLLLIKTLINDNRIELSNELKLNIVLFFMENNCLNSDLYPEIKDIKFQDSLIEILNLIDNFTYDDSEKLYKLIGKCESNYNKLVEYIKSNFKN